MLGINKSDLAGGARWMRDHFGKWLAGTTSMTFMWLGVAAAIAVLFYWDGIWSRDQAPEGMELSFQAGGWVIRIWTIFALVSAVMLYKAKAGWLASVVLLTWVMTSVLSYGHALGFIATGQAERYAGGAAVENRAEITTTGTEDKLALLERQKAEIRADRDADVLALESALDDLINDGNARNDAEATETYTALIGEVRAEARQRLKELSDRESDIILQGTQEQLTINDEAVTAVKFDPFYLLIADWFFKGSRDDNLLRAIAQRWGAFWALMIELIGGAGPAILYAAHDHFAARRERSVRAKKGHETRKRNAKEAPDAPLPIEYENYWSRRIMKALSTAMKDDRRTVEGMSNTYFEAMPLNELRAHLNRELDNRLELPKADPKAHKRAINRGFLSPDVKTYFIQEHIDFIFLEGDYAPQQINGEDKGHADDPRSDNLPATT